MYIMLTSVCELISFRICLKVEEEYKLLGSE